MNEFMPYNVDKARLRRQEIAEVREMNLREMSRAYRLLAETAGVLFVDLWGATPPAPWMSTASIPMRKDTPPSPGLLKSNSFYCYSQWTLSEDLSPRVRGLR